jgi:hypothetical protein
LREIANRFAVLDDSFAGIGFDQPRGDLEQRRFSGAVPADKAQPVPWMHEQFRARKQGFAAKRN